MAVAGASAVALSWRNPMLEFSLLVRVTIKQLMGLGRVLITLLILLLLT